MGGALVAHIGDRPGLRPQSSSVQGCDRFFFWGGGGFYRGIVVLCGLYWVPPFWETAIQDVLL